MKSDDELLAAKLTPFFEMIMKNGSGLAKEVVTDFSAEASKGFAGFAFGTIGAVVRAVARRVKHSRARTSFEDGWRTATDAAGREDAVRTLFREDPQLVASLDLLLAKRDLLLAMREHCEHLQRIPLSDPHLRLSDIYVPLDLRAVDDTAASSGDQLVNDLPHEGNHVIVGPAGCGKSAFARRFVISRITALIEDPTGVDFDRVRLPVLVSARTLASTSAAFSDMLREAISQELALFGVYRLPERLFVPGAADGHPAWLVVVDGLDEVTDEQQRQRLWDALMHHARLSDSFRFVATMRPDAVRIRQSQRSSLWSVMALDLSQLKRLAERHLPDAATLETFLQRTRDAAYAGILNLPLFATMAACIFRRDSNLPHLKDELCRLFVSQLLQKSVDPALVNDLLEACATFPERAVGAVLESTPVLAARFSRGESRFVIEDEALSALVATGFGRVVAQRFEFAHQLFASHFRAARFIRDARPTAQLWRVHDPYRLGWDTVEFACVGWAQQGRNISSAVRALLSYGEPGLACAIAIAATAPCGISERVVNNITERLLSELRTTGGTIAGLTALTRLARRHDLVRRGLVDVAHARDDFLSSRLNAAECLLDAGHQDDGQFALKRICEDHDVYGADRVSAAERLLELGDRETALAALNDEAMHGDELWTRLDAACAYLTAEPSKVVRELVADLLRECREEGERIHGGILRKLVEIGEADLIESPLLTALQPREDGLESEIPRAAINAALLLAKTDRDAAIATLRGLLKHAAFSLRGRAEIIAALCQLEEEPLARTILEEEVLHAPIGEIDWFVFDLMLQLGLNDAVGRLARREIIAGLESADWRRSPHDIFEKVYQHLDLRDLAPAFTNDLRVRHHTRSASCLAKLGKREEAVAILQSWIVLPDRNLAIAGAECLCTLGERDTGVRALYAWCVDNALDGETRIQAAQALAQVDERLWASRAFRTLIRDETLTMSCRCRAAIGLEELGVPTWPIWTAFFDVLEDPTRSLADRLTAAKHLKRTKVDEWGDQDHFDVEDELWALLGSEGWGGADRLAIARELAGYGYGLDELPGVMDLLRDEAISRVIKISFLEKICRYSGGDVAETCLVSITDHPTVTLRKTLSVLGKLKAPSACKAALGVLHRIAADRRVPPKWRIEAAAAMSDKANSHDAMHAVADDVEVALRHRLEALQKLAPGAAVIRGWLRIALNTPGLTVEELVEIAAVAADAEDTSTTRVALHRAAAQSPLLPHEATAIAEAFSSIGEGSLAFSFLASLFDLPDAILENMDGLDSAIEAIKLAPACGLADAAVTFAVRLLQSNLTSWYEVADVLAALRDIGRGDLICEVVPQVSAHLREALLDPMSDYPGACFWAWRRIREFDPSLDIDMLHKFAKDPMKAVEYRVQAAAMLAEYGEASAQGQAREIARQALGDLVPSEPSKIIALAAHFTRCGLSIEVQKLADKQSIASEDVGELLSIARIFQSLGDLGRAGACLRRARELSAGGLPLNYVSERLIERLEGPGVLVAERQAAVHDDGRDLSDRLNGADALVESEGDGCAIRLLQDTLCGPANDACDRLRALEILEGLGFRALARAKIDELRDLPESDDYWIGDQLLRQGRKVEALAALERSISSAPEGYENQIAARLAELGALDALKRLSAEWTTRRASTHEETVPLF